MTNRIVRYASLLAAVLLLETWIFFFMETKKRARAIRLHWYVIMSFIFFLGVVYIWRRVSTVFASRKVFSFKGLARIASLTVLVMAQSCLLLSLAFVNNEPLALNTAASYCLGFVIFLAISCVAVDIAAWFIHSLVLRSKKRQNITLKTILSLSLALIMTASGMWSLSQLEVKHVTLPVKGLHPRLNGTTVVQLSDIHLGPFNGKSALNELVGRVNGLKPDLVLITGDLVDSTVSNLQEAVTPLRDIKSKHGVYFSTGQ